MADLTPRQQQIADLIQQGKDPKQIAKQLRISRNAVYQQLRRIREGGGASRSSGRQSSRRSQRRPARDANATTRVTPLQAIRARKTEIEGELRESRHNVEQAERAWKQAHDAHDKLGQRHDDELRNLTKAEAALSGKSPAAGTAARKRRTRRSTARRRATRARGSQNGGKAREAAQASS